MKEYPKIETVWVRDDATRKVMPGSFRWPEFGLVRDWQITEKIDGTNIRIGLNPDGTLAIGGRTDSAQVPTPLLGLLMKTFEAGALREKFKDADFTIFGEGYGPKIQNGGGYSDVPCFRVFDVLVDGWWLEPNNVADVALSFSVDPVPHLGTCSEPPHYAEELAEIITDSLCAPEDNGTGCRAEGIVARTSPGLFSRRGDRIMWKLKFKDFGGDAQGRTP